MMRIAVFGNCQSHELARALGLMLDGAEVEACDPQGLARLDAAGLRRLADADLVLAQRNFDFGPDMAPAEGKPVLFPRIAFRGFHPDMIYVQQGGRNQAMAFGFYHSAIAFAAHRLGIGLAETLRLYTDAVFDRLGYHDRFAEARGQLLAEGERCGLPLEHEIGRWLRGGAFMHTINHPSFRVMGGLARLLVDRLGLKARLRTPEDFAEDGLREGAVWAVYPPIAARLGIEGSYAFKAPKARGGRVAGLEAFVAASFAFYDAARDKALSAPAVDLDACERAFAAALAPATADPGPTDARAAPTPNRSARRNPYLGLPPHQFWRKAVSDVALADIDPVVEAPFTIARTDRLGSAGSCFAQHIARTLQRSGYNYFVPEAAPQGMPDDEAARLNFGVFSARFGNIYTARQLVQLFDRAHGRFTPADRAWMRPDGRWADPFRPQIEPEGFATEAGVEAAREVHLAAVRRLFAEVDVFVFTLGLTEAWAATGDSAVFPLAPGVAAGAPDPERYRFVNFTAAEVEADMLAFLDRLRGVNPRARVVLTVSPVPLVATYEPRSVIVSTCASKSALRVAAEQVCRARPGVAYYPSYELITGPFSRGAYFEDDLRNVTPEGVAHAMRLFVRHYGEPEAVAADAAAPDALFDVVCEEERLDTGS